MEEIRKKKKEIELEESTINEKYDDGTRENDR
jgi:hypothetical protein